MPISARKGFCPLMKKGLSKQFQLCPHNLYVIFKLAFFYCCIKACPGLSSSRMRLRRTWPETRTLVGRYYWNRLHKVILLAGPKPLLTSLTFITYWRVADTVKTESEGAQERNEAKDDLEVFPGHLVEDVSVDVNLNNIIVRNAVNDVVKQLEETEQDHYPDQVGHPKVSTNVLIWPEGDQPNG